MVGYKVRIADGSEIGPLDLAALRTWFNQGLIDRDSPVLKPGSKRWSTFGEIPELKGLLAHAPITVGKSKGRKTGRAAPVVERAPAMQEDERGSILDDPDRLRLRVAGALFLLLAAGVGFLAFRPQNTTADLDGAPWMEIALGLLVCSLVLLPGWGFGRKLVRVLVVLAAVALFPVMGILYAQGVRGAALFAVGSVWLMLSGFIAYLGEWLSWAKMIALLVPILAGAYGFFHFGVSPETDAQREVRTWAAAETRYEDPTIGVTLDPPPGWIVLKQDNPFVKAPPEARVAFAQPRLSGFAFLQSESSPPGISSLDQYLNRFINARSKTTPSLKEQARSDVVFGQLSGRKSVATWDDGGVRQHDTSVVWRDGWVYFGLAAWAPEEGAARPQMLDQLAEGVRTQGVFAARLQSAVQMVTRDVPQLTAPAAEMLMSQSEAKVLEPDQAFRRSLDALSRAIPTLSKTETQELSQITSATYASLPWKDRGRLAAYVDRVRNRQSTSPGEDREMGLLMKTAVLQLPPMRRLRLQALYEKAIRGS
jgi:GYF domain 2